MSSWSTRAIAGASVIALVGGAGSASAATKKAPPKKVVRMTQTFTLSYKPFVTEHAATPVGGSFWLCAGAVGNCLNFDTPKWARYMSVTSTDQSGQKVPMSIYPNSGGSGLTTETFVCGSVKSAPIAQNSAWTLSVDTASVDSTCPSIATTGTVTVIVSNLR